MASLTINNNNTNSKTSFLRNLLSTKSISFIIGAALVLLFSFSRFEVSEIGEIGTASKITKNVVNDISIDENNNEGALKSANSVTSKSTSTNLNEEEEDKTNNEEVSSSNIDDTFQTDESSGKKQLLPNCKLSKNINVGANAINKNIETRTIRWSERTYFPISNVESPFNCYLDSSLCTYFYPANFFDSTCGIGKKYIPYATDAEHMRINRTLWNFMPAVGFPTITLKDICFYEELEKKSGNPKLMFGGAAAARGEELVYDKTRNLEKAFLHDIGVQTVENYAKNSNSNTTTLTCMTERLTMLHVHKVGGTSLHSAFDSLDRRGRGKGAQQVRHKFFTPSKRPLGFYANNTSSSSTTVKRKEDKMYMTSLESLTEHATKYPEKKYVPNQHVIFALVRDPVERFISSIGQALGANGSEENHIGPVIQGECVDDKESSAEALKCIAKYVQEHGFWVELHFTPQVIDISFTTLWADVPISIFSFRHIKTVLKYLGADNIQARNGKKEGYRNSNILSEMTVDDYDDETLKIVCEIYEMDVIMQRSLGMEVERCDPYVPK